MTDTPMHPHERITDPGYFEQVLANMEWVPHPIRRVWFGTRGHGVSPHYQTGWPPEHPQAHEVRRFDGRNHNAYHTDPLAPFNLQNLVGPYSWDQVCVMAGKTP